MTKNQSFKYRSYAVYVIVLGFLTAFGPVCSDIYLPSLPIITAYFQSTPALLQVSLSSCFAGIAIGQLILGSISDVFGRRGLLLGSLLVFAVSSWLCALAESVAMLIVLRFIQGFVGGGGIVLARTMACDVFAGSKLTACISVLMAVNSTAPVIAPFIGSALISFLPWQYLFYAMGVWGAIMLLFAWFIAGETLDLTQQAVKGSSPFKAMFSMFNELSNLRFLLLVMVFAVVNMGFFSYLSVSPFIFEIIYGFSPAGYSLIFSVFSLMISISSLLAGRLSSRWGEHKVTLWSLYLMLAFSLLFLLVSLVHPESVVYAFVLLLVYGTMMGSSFTAGFTILMGESRGGKGAASGIFGVVTYFCGALAMPLSGAMGEKSMLPLGLILAISSSLAVVLYLAYRLKSGKILLNSEV